MNARVTHSVTTADGTIIATVYYEDGVNDGDFVVRQTANKTTTIHKGEIRVTKALAPTVYYGVFGVFADWQEAGMQVQPMEAQAILTVTVWANVNLTGREDGTHAWDEAAIADYAKDKVREALHGIETMVPEGMPSGGVLLTDLKFDFHATEVDGL